MGLNNFGVVYDSGTAKLYRSAQPLGSWDADTIRRLGVGLVVKLNSGTESGSIPAEDEARLLAPATISAVEQSSFNPDVQSTRKIVCEIYVALAAGVSVLVHCTHGRDRTGLVCGAFRLLTQEWSLAQVNEERAAYGVTGLILMADHNINEVLAEIAESVHA